MRLPDGSGGELGDDDQMDPEVLAKMALVNRDGGGVQQGASEGMGGPHVDAANVVWDEQAFSLD